MKKLFSPKAILLTAGILAGALTQSARADLVYANTNNQTGFIQNTLTYETGDEIILAGSSRLATNFTFQFWTAGISTNTTVEIRFYANDGTGGAPGTSLWDSGAYNLMLLDSGFSTTNGATLSYDMSVLVPNDFTWTVQFANLDGGTAGVPIFTPPSLGGNYSDYWENNGTGWLLKTNASTDMSFAATLQAAVPEPSTFALAIVGGIGFLLARRRR